MRKTLTIALLCTAGCLDPTQATIELRTNAPCGDSTQLAGTLRETGILAGSASRVQTSDLNTSTSQCESSGAIGTVVLYPDSDAKDASLIAIGALGDETAENCLEIVQGRKEGSVAACIIARRRVSFVEQRDLVIPVLLDDACAGQPCKDDTTCVRVTNENGAVGTQCVDAKVTCEDDGSCTHPGTGGGSSQGGAGGMTSSQGGAGGSTTTSSQGGAGGMGAGGVGAGGGPQIINALQHLTPGLTSVHVVSGDNMGVLASGTGSPAVAVRANGVVVATYNSQTSVEMLLGTPQLTAVFSNGGVKFGSVSYVPGTPKLTSAVSTNSATAYGVDSQTETVWQIDESGVISTAQTMLSVKKFRAITKSDYLVMAGTEVCGWTVGSTTYFCDTPPSASAQVDVWMTGVLGYSVGGSAVEQITINGNGVPTLALTETPLPLEPDLGIVTLTSVHGNFGSSGVWFGGKVGSAAYLAHVTGMGAWEEFVGANLSPIEDLWLQGDGTVWFASGGKLYSFQP